MLRLATVALGVALAFACGCGSIRDDSVPDEYAGRVNPMHGNSQAKQAGRVLFARNCMYCHGQFGFGDGPEAELLDPAPPSFRDRIGQYDDDYLLWRISEGGNGDPMWSDMPGWKHLLVEEDIWKIVTFLRDLD